MEEKTEFGHQAEHVETNSLDANEEKKDLSKVQTLAVVDVENKAAFKGDESDGKIEWTFKTLMAATFLCMLYTGETRTSVSSELSDSSQALRLSSTLSAAHCNSSHQT